MSFRSRSHVKASMFLTRVAHLFIRDYIPSFLNIIVRPIVMVCTGFETRILLHEYLTPIASLSL